MSKIVLVGLDNPQSSDPKHALYPWPPGCSGHRLQKHIMQIPRREYLKLFERDNLFNDCMKYGGASEALRRALELYERHSGATKFVVFGNEAGTAMCSWVKYFAWNLTNVPANNRVQNRVVKVTVSPHPSGRNRWWNDAQNTAKARRFFHKLITESRE